jgi:hypothetical protein
MYLSLADTSVSDDVNVIPEPVRLSSIQIAGTWEEFLIKWDPVTNVNYDQVFYEVKIYDFSKTDFSEPVSTLKLFKNNYFINLYRLCITSCT